MSQTSPPTITASPTVPQRSDRVTFSGRVDAFVTWMAAAVTQFGAVATNVYNNAVDAYNNAVAAAASASSASASASTASNAASSAIATAGAAQWVSSTTYSIGDVVWSPSNSQTYRRIVAGAGTTDPSTDAANWTMLGGSSAHSGLKNYVINGGMDVWQRATGTTALTTNTSTYTTADCWKCTPRSGAGNTARVALTPGEVQGFAYALNVNITSTATTQPVLLTVLENSMRFLGKTVTLSFYAKASKTISIDAKLDLIFASADNYTTAQTISATTSWTKFTMTFTLPSASGTYNPANDNTSVNLYLPLSDTYSFYLTGVQLEDGSTATSFEQRPYGMELALCQRYYERFTYTSGQVGPSAGYAQTATVCDLTFPIYPKRSAPSVALSGAGTAQVMYSTGTTTNITVQTIYGRADRAGVSVQFSTASVLTPASPVQFYANAGDVNVDFNSVL